VILIWFILLPFFYARQSTERTRHGYWHGNIDNNDIIQYNNKCCVGVEHWHGHVSDTDTPNPKSVCAS
jgi:hypothetical protein